jgi:hypothetical protein
MFRPNRSRPDPVSQIIPLLFGQLRFGWHCEVVLGVLHNLPDSALLWLPRYHQRLIRSDAFECTFTLIKSQPSFLTLRSMAGDTLVQQQRSDPGLENCFVSESGLESKQQNSEHTTSEGGMVAGGEVGEE